MIREVGAATGQVLDHDVHGIVGLRLVDATAADVAVVTRQLGPLHGQLSRPPDIVVRFVDSLAIGQLEWIEFGRTGVTDEGFVVFEYGRRSAGARIGFDPAGGCLELVCERGLRRVPLLIGLLTLSALRHGYVPLHASAFVYQGTGVLVTGWAKGGKTEALLAFAARGAEYIGDEWILLSPDGRSMHGVPEHIRLQDWHFRQVPATRAHLRTREVAKFAAIRALDRLHGAWAAGPLGRVPPIKALGAALPVLRRQLNVQLNPLAVFGEGPHAFSASLDRVFFMLSDVQPTVRVAPANPDEITQRMTASIAYEHLPLSGTCLAYQFAYPGRLFPAFKVGRERIAALLRGALAGKESYVVRHPYPCDLGELFEAMAPFCGMRERSHTKASDEQLTGAVLGAQTDDT